MAEVIHLRGRPFVQGHDPRRGTPRTFPIPTPTTDNPLVTVAWLIHQDVVKSELTLTEWAASADLSQSTLSHIINGRKLKNGSICYERYLPTETIEKLASKLRIPSKDINTMVPVTYEERCREMGLQLGEKYKHHPKRLNAISRAKKASPLTGRQFARMWAEQREEMEAQLTAARADSIGASKSPASRVKKILGQSKRRHPAQEIKATVIEELARDCNCLGQFDQGGLPMLYVRGKLYELTALPWPGKHRPAITRFELVYSLKQQGKEWRDISAALKHHGEDLAPMAIRRWWQQFWAWTPPRKLAETPHES